MNRRSFFRYLKRPRQSLPLSGEALYMRYVDARLEGSERRFIRNLQAELAEQPRLTDADWLEQIPVTPKNGKG